MEIGPFFFFLHSLVFNSWHLHCFLLNLHHVETSLPPQSCCFAECLTSHGRMVCWWIALGLRCCRVHWSRSWCSDTFKVTCTNALSLHITTHTNKMQPRGQWTTVYWSRHFTTVTPNKGNVNALIASLCDFKWKLLNGATVWLVFFSSISPITDKCSPSNSLPVSPALVAWFLVLVVIFLKNFFNLLLPFFILISISCSRFPPSWWPSCVSSVLTSLLPLRVFQSLCSQDQHQLCTQWVSGLSVLSSARLCPSILLLSPRLPCSCILLSFKPFLCVLVLNLRVTEFQRLSVNLTTKQTFRLMLWVIIRLTSSFASRPFHLFTFAGAKEVLEHSNIAIKRQINIFCQQSSGHFNHTSSQWLSEAFWEEEKSPWLTSWQSELHLSCDHSACYSSDEEWGFFLGGDF